MLCHHVLSVWARDQLIFRLYPVCFVLCVFLSQTILATFMMALDERDKDCTVIKIWTECGFSLLVPVWTIEHVWDKQAWNHTWAHLREKKKMKSSPFVAKCSLFPVISVACVVWWFAAKIRCTTAAWNDNHIQQKNTASNTFRGKTKCCTPTTYALISWTLNIVGVIYNL